MTFVFGLLLGMVIGAVAIIALTAFGACVAVAKGLGW